MAKVMHRGSATAALESNIRARFDTLKATLHERGRRQWAAAEAKTAGPGAISLVSRATGICRRAIARGLDELADPSPQVTGRRVRLPGAGAIRLSVKTPTLLEALDRLVEPTTRGDPESPLRWTCKSTRNLAEVLRQQGYRMCHESVARLLRAQRYSLQGNRTLIEGADHPDRDAQFAHIHQTARSFVAEGQPGISVDTKKKARVGHCKNPGREWQPVGAPQLVKDHDVPDPLGGKVTPYGVYDVADNSGWVSVGMDHDTAECAVESLRRWWNRIGRCKYPEATRLLITADGGGSHGTRVRLWKIELQKLADELDLAITVCHFPPGTSTWNKIAHQLCSFISMNWRGEPLRDYQTIIGLIGSTKTRTGLTVRCDLDTNRYPTGVKVSDEEMASLNLTRHIFHGEWNYTIAPRPGIK